MTDRQRADAEVIVVGGGPAGSSIAYRLARAGCDVLLLDRARFPRDKPCSEYLSPQAGRLLADMDVLDRLEQYPTARLTGMRVTAPDGRSFSGSFAAETAFRPFRPWGLAVRRTILDHELLSRAREAGVEVREDTRVQDLLRNPAGGVVGVRTGDADVRARIVIGADGLRSIVARRAGLGAHGRWPQRIAYVTHYRGIAHASQVGDMHVFDDGYVGFAPVGGGVTNVAVVVPRSRAAASAGNPTGFMERELARRPSTRRRIESARRVTPVRAIGPFNWRARVAWSPGVALVGDAADFFDPFTGEGIYAALRGAELLTGYAFDAVRAPERADVALAAWDRCRKHEFGGKWIVERLIGAAVASPIAMNRAARALAARPELADRLVGVTGDFVPASEVLGLRYILALVAASLAGTGTMSITEPPAPAPARAPRE